MKSPKMMYGYAAFLVIVSVAAYAISGFASVTALIPVVMGAIMALMGWMASKVETSRGMGMFGIHAGMVLPLLFALMFAHRAYGQFTAEETKMYLAVTFVILCVGSIIGFIMILLARPKPDARG
jgi:hypothetical protein